MTAAIFVLYYVIPRQHKINLWTEFWLWLLPSATLLLFALSRRRVRRVSQPFLFPTTFPPPSRDTRAPLRPPNFLEGIKAAKTVCIGERVCLGTNSVSFQLLFLCSSWAQKIRTYLQLLQKRLHPKSLRPPKRNAYRFRSASDPTFRNKTIILSYPHKDFGKTFRKVE